MLIRCSERHREECLHYLKQEPVLNLFFIADIENYGFDHDFQTLFIDKTDSIHAVYLVFHDTLLIASVQNEVDQNLTEKLIDEYKIRTIQGQQQLLNQLKLIHYKAEECWFCVTDKTCYETGTTLPIQKATVDDVKEIQTLLTQVFQQEPLQAMLENRILSNEGRHVFIKDDNKVIAQANSTAETQEAAMIGGVATDPQYRCRGLATALVSYLCNELLTQKKQPCLFFSDEQAGRIYQKLGFKKIANWTILNHK